MLLRIRSAMLLSLSLRELVVLLLCRIGVHSPPQTVTILVLTVLRILVLRVVLFAVQLLCIVRAAEVSESRVYLHRGGSRRQVMVGLSVSMSASTGRRRPRSGLAAVGAQVCLLPCHWPIQ